jgi:hypothetical protein
MVWLALAEAVLVVHLAFLAWHVWQTRFAPVPPVAALPAPPTPAAGPDTLPAPPSAPAARSPEIGPTPGLRTDRDFLTRQMVELNRVEATFEELEWRVSETFVNTIQRYLEGVVLPSIERSERGGR